MRYYIALAALALSSCAASEGAVEAGAAEVATVASIIPHIGSNAQNRVRLELGQPYTLKQDGLRLMIVHDRRSMVTNFAGNTIKYEVLQTSSMSGRDASYDFTQEANRIANFGRRIVIFAQPIEQAPDVDRVFIEAFCDTQSQCDVAKRIAETVRFN